MLVSCILCSLNIPAIRRRVLEQLRSQTPAAASGSLARPPPRLPPIPPHELRRNTLAKPDLNALLLVSLRREQSETGFAN